jgi:5,10-methylenetetrahydromethanopterin reductase
LAKKIPADFSNLIRARQARKSVKEFSDFKQIKKHSEILLRNFTISGCREDVLQRIDKLLKLCDEVVLGDPFFRDIDSLRSLKSLIKC